MIRIIQHENNYMLDAISVQAVHKIFCLFIFIEDFLLVETFDGQLCYSGRTKSFPIILWERKINKSAQTKIFAFWMKISHISALSFSYISQAPIHDKSKNKYCNKVEFQIDWMDTGTMSL